MNRLPPHAPQLRHPLADEFAVGIEALALQQGVEDAEVRLGIDARAGAEAPPAVVGREVAVDQHRHEVDFAEAPVQQQVFGQEGRDDHPAAVVHVGGAVQLPHRGVDDRVAGLPGAPGAEGGGGVLPGDVGVFGFEGFVHAAVGAVSAWTFVCLGGGERGLRGGVSPNVGPVGEDVLVEVAPGDFGDPGYDAEVPLVELFRAVDVSGASDGGAGG